MKPLIAGPITKPWLPSSSSARNWETPPRLRLLPTRNPWNPKLSQSLSHPRPSRNMNFAKRTQPAPDEQRTTTNDQRPGTHPRTLSQPIPNQPKMNLAKRTQPLPNEQQTTTNDERPYAKLPKDETIGPYRLGRFIDPRGALS